MSMNDGPDREPSGDAAHEAIKYGAWIVIVLMVLYFLAVYVIPLFKK